VARSEGLAPITSGARDDALKRGADEPDGQDVLLAQRRTARRDRPSLAFRRTVHRCSKHAGACRSAW
jgi:hypothetical protein